MADTAILTDIVETWRIRREEAAAKSQNRTNAASLREFVEIMNACTKRLISEFQMNDPEFYSALFELAQHASTLTTKGAKVFVDKVDRTND